MHKKQFWVMQIANYLTVLVVLLSLTSCQNKAIEEYDGYLFSYFVGNGPGEESVHYAISDDGYNYYALNNNKPVLDSKLISKSGGVRDPHILRGEDGNFYMVLTDLYVPEMGWQNTAMVLLKSTDLITWSHSLIDIPKTYPEDFSAVNRVWAPQTIYDTKKGKYMLYWSMRHNEDADIIYYAYANEDFTGLEAAPKQLLYKEGACIDGDIVFKEGKYHMFFKNEDEGAKGILKAVSENINEGYVVGKEYVDQTDDAVEGSGTFKLIGTDTYILMYDMYTTGKYQFCASKDLENFKVIDTEVSMNFHPRHGSVIPITKKEKEALLAKWGTIGESTFLSFNSETIKNNNVVIDDENNTIYLPLKPDANNKELHPNFEMVPGVKVSPLGSQDFSNGAIDYTFSIGNKAKTYKVSVSKDNNPVLDGFYADPEILFSHKTNKYYLYPTSDGFTGWAGTYFKTFSSTDLVNWQDEGVILDLEKDVSWTSRNAWAPTITEKKVNGEYKYFYYFTAAQKIGVAVSDNPTGPFVDSGKPIVGEKPKGIRGGQEIDPDVFIDPVSGKSYLYWGNGYLACVELNEDMVSYKKNTLKIMTPNTTFREGCEVFYRNGKYYFLWSENDTRSPDYRVRYATSNSPTGPLNIPKNNLILSMYYTEIG